MSLAALLKQSVTVQRIGQTGTDTYGSPTYGVVSSYTSSAYLDQAPVLGTFSTGEQLLNRQTVSADWLLMLPAGSAIDANDRVVYDGKTFEVVGEPREVFNPRLGVNAQIECRLIEQTG